MRGNARCRRSEGFESIRRLKNELVGLEIVNIGQATKWFFGVSGANAELVIRQFVFDRYGGIRLTNGIFEYHGCGKPIKTALPEAWRNYLSSNDLPVNQFLSAVAWQLEMTSRLLKGVLVIGMLCTKQIFRNRPVLLPEKYAYLEGLTSTNLPPKNKKLQRYDICSWYAKWSGKSSGIKAIVHDVKGEAPRAIDELLIVYAPHPYEFAMGWRGSLSFAIWSVAAVIWAGLNLIAGRWYWALMLGEVAKAKVVSEISSNRLAAEYLFHASRTIYRPLWTYEAEQKGAQIELYFYSTYAQPKLANGDVKQIFEWGPNTWPKFIVWDDLHESRLRRDMGETFAVVKAGPIFFSDTEDPLPPIPENTIAIFDIQPHRISSHLGFSTLADCLAVYPNFYHQFLLDVTETLMGLGVTAALKTKREIGARRDRRYGKIIKMLELETDFLFINPAIAAIRLTSACVATISAPYTSTALYAKELGRPSVYYDPVGWIQRDDEAAHGIQIISGKNELQVWVKETLANARAD